MAADSPDPDRAELPTKASLDDSLGAEVRAGANATSLDPAILKNRVTEARQADLSTSNAVRELQLISNQLFRAANELKRTNQFQSMILDNINQGVIVIDEYSQLVAWNEVFLRTYQVGKRALHKGMTIQDFSEFFSEKELRAPGSAGKFAHIVHLQSLEPGEYIDQLSSGTSVEIRIDKRETGGLIATFTDVTSHIDIRSRLKEQEKQLREQVKKLKVTGQALEEARNQAVLADQQKSRFLAMISHDIRTPIGAVISILELLSDPAMKGDRDRLQQVALTSGKQMLFLLADIIEVSRSDGWNFSIEHEAVDLRELLTSIAESWRPLAKKKLLRLDLEVDKALSSLVMVDPKRLRQVLDNLLSNAIKYTGKGCISLAATMTSRSVRFEVNDSGSGISHSEQSKMFREFGRVINADNLDVEGTGLGLTICKRIVESMGGTIGFDSRIGSGSMFWLEVPCLFVDSEDHRVGERPPQISLITQTGLAPYVLIADDLESNRLILGNLLEKLGCRIVAVPDGQDVVERLESETFDAILMDISMPTVDGVEATRRIRALGTRQSEIPIVGVTA